MTAEPFRTDRHIVPRWRPFRLTTRLGELAIPNTTKGAHVRHVPTADLERCLRRWESEQTLENAAELVAAAIVARQETVALQAAHFVITSKTVMPLVARQAAIVLERSGQLPVIQSLSEAAQSYSVRACRQRTRDYPNDALAWADLAFAHVLAGNNDSAERAIRVALGLAPNDRHILRAAARFHVHAGDHSAAHDVLARSDVTKHDPWLMASEIAVSHLAKRKPRSFKTGQQMLDDFAHDHGQITELAAAIATVHLRDGNRRARKMFILSADKPNGNALAQVEWAVPLMGSEFEIKPGESNPDGAEARLFHHYRTGEFEEALQACTDWAVEEPYSTRPFAFKSSIATVLRRYEQAIEFAETGLKLQPHHPTLLNNKAYALAALNRLEEALETVKLANLHSPETAKGVPTATLGMIHFRLGDHASGRKHYRDAIAWLGRNRMLPSAALATAYFAKEAARANAADAAELLREAKHECDRFPFLPEAPSILNRAEYWLAAHGMRNTNATPSRR